MLGFVNGRSCAHKYQIFRGLIIIVIFVRSVEVSWSRHLRNAVQNYSFFLISPTILRPITQLDSQLTKLTTKLTT